MPAWSPEIANEIISLAASDGKAFNQMHLQELVYVAHGWCLAITGQPLTGDRPEALEFGPEYRRLADVLTCWGIEPVTSEIRHPQSHPNRSKTDATSATSEFSPDEHEILRRIYAEYGNLQPYQLALLTRSDGTPWEKVFAGGAGNGRDIPHQLIRAQFEQIAAKIGPKGSR